MDVQVNLFIQFIFIGYLLCSKHYARTGETVVNSPEIFSWSLHSSEAENNKQVKKLRKGYVFQSK